MENNTTPPSSKKRKRLRIAKVSALLAFLGLVLILVARGDEALDPNYQRFFYADTPVPDEENMLYILTGIDAPSGKDFAAYGRSIYKGLVKQPIDYTYLVRREEINTDCWIRHVLPEEKDTCKDNPSESRLRQLIADNQKMLKRYESVHHYSRFQQGTYASVLFVDILRLHELWVASLVLEASDGRANQALHKLAKNTAFWQRLMSDKPNMVAAAVFLLMQKINNEAMPLIIAGVSTEDLAQQKKELTKLLDTPALHAEGWNLYATLRAEQEYVFAEMEKWYNDAVHTRPNLTRFIYKPNATKNLYYNFAQKVLSISKIPIPQAVTEFIKLARDKECLTEPLKDWKITPEYFTKITLRGGLNTLGEEIVCGLSNGAGLVAAALKHYSYRQMVKIYIMARIENVSPNQMAAYVAASAIRNPLTGKPFEIDEKRQLLMLKSPQYEPGNFWSFSYAPLLLPNRQ